MVAPKWEPCLKGRFYYYERDSIEFSMQMFHAHHNGEDHSIDLRAPTGSIEIPKASSDEVNTFLATQGNNNSNEVSRDADEQYKIFLENINDFRKWRQGISLQ
jgi:hypothetical protein